MGCCGEELVAIGLEHSATAQQLCIIHNMEHTAIPVLQTPVGMDPYMCPQAFNKASLFGGSGDLASR